MAADETMESCFLGVNKTLEPPRKNGKKSAVSGDFCCTHRNMLFTPPKPHSQFLQMLEVHRFSMIP